MRCLLFILLTSFTSLVQAQNQQISGLVLNGENQPISHASIRVLNRLAAATTRGDGSFSLPLLPPGNYTLSFAAEGFASVQKMLNIPDSNLNVTAILQPTYAQLEAVTVTAEKKEDNVQTVPLSLSVLTAKQVEEYRLWNTQQLTAIVPSLYSDNPGDERNVTSIRGIVTTSYDPAVATYIDGVNQFSLDTYLSALSDVERIEVLRGPQGTLYGRNAMGGVVNIITKKPTNQTEVYGRVSIGNYSLQRYEAGFRKALVKNKLFFGASLLYNKRNGYYTNDFLSNSFDKQHLLYGNYYVTYEPTDRWRISLNAKHAANRNNGAFPLVNGKDEAFNHPFHLSQNATATMMDNTFNSSLHITHTGTATSFHAISTYQTNYRYYDAPLDGDFSPADIVSVINNYGKPYNKVTALTQELRVSSVPGDSRLAYTAGAYFFYQHSPTRQATYFGEDAGLYGLPDTDFSIINRSDSKGTGAALFGQMAYKLTTKLQLIAGLRYDYEHRRQTVEGSYAKGDFEMITQADTSARANFNAVSPKLGLQYLFNKQSNLFASYSRGFRTGGLSPLSSDPSQPPLYRYLPEYSNNLEAGSKNVLFNNRLSLNVTVYTSFINNAQVPTLVLPEALTIVKNTGKLRTAGVETEISAIPVKGVQITYNGSIIRTSYQSLKLSQNGAVTDLQGKHQIYTPAATSLLAAQYSHPLSANAKLVLRSEWQYRGKTYFDFNNTLYQAAYHLLHLRAGIESKKWAAFVWCRNAANKKYIAYAYDFGAVHLGEPRTFGITLSAHIAQ